MYVMQFGLPLKPDNSEFAELFKDKVVLITGGTGFLGRNLTEEILRFEPQSIRLFSRDEVKHHKAEELFNHHQKLRSFVGDVRDYERLDRAMKGADIVIHAAALKRLDLIEYNVDESIKTNVLGTLNVIHASLANHVKKVIFISTDKACSPVNTYGACKFLGERIAIESNFSKGKADIQFICVRYGNVLESTGSVIPFFEEKIKGGKKIPLTDERMTRFIITPKQAANLIFKAIKYGRGGEIFVPILPAFKITDLIEILKEKHQTNTETEIVGVRPGEKIHELMINRAEVPRTYKFNDTYVITSQIEKYFELGPAAYMNQHNRLHEGLMTEYSSEHALIPKEEVAKLFQELGLL